MSGGSLTGGILMTMHRLSQGGADRVAVVLANGFADAGIPTELALLRDGGEGEHVLRPLLRADVPLSSAGPPMGSRHLELGRGLPFIQRRIASARPSLVLASSNNMGLVTGLSAKLPNSLAPRFALKVTNPVVRPEDRGPIKRLYRRRLYGFVFGNYDRVLTLTESERATLTRMYPDQARKFETAANPYVAPAMLAPFTKRRESGAPAIVTLARMMPQKRLDRLLVAFSRVTCRESRLAIVGDGPERSKLESLAATLGIAARVDMPGFVADVVPWLRQADLFVLSSDYEGLPAAVLEALACNVPVVTTDCFDGARALLGGADRCAVVPRGNVEAFARAIDASLAGKNDPAGLRQIAQRYSFDAAVKAHIRLVTPLIRF